MSSSNAPGDTVQLHASSARSDMDAIEDLIRATPPPGAAAAAVPSARSPSPPRASIPVSSSSSSSSASSPAPSAPINAATKLPFSAAVPAPAPTAAPPSAMGSVAVPIGADGFGPAPNTLTEPVWDTVKRDLTRIVTNLKLVVFPNPFREDPGKALRDWDLWGPFFFIVFLGLILSWSATVRKISSVCRCLCCISCRCYNSHTECSTAGWAHHLLPKPQSSWILPVPPGCWSPDLHVEGQCYAKDYCGNGNISMELLGSLSIHKHRC
ncbi:hypothetical protein ACP4OV_021368 [Aristida adscensionis]